MKKLVILLLILALAVPVSAQNASRITDEVGLLSQSEIDALNELSLSDTCGLYVYVAQDYRDYGYDLESAGEAIYNSLGMGLGDDRTGLMLLLSMDERDFLLLAHGQEAHIAFTEYGKEALASYFLPELGDDDWAGGFETFFLMADAFLAEARKGEPVDVPEYSGDDIYYYESPKAPAAAGWFAAAVLGMGLGIGIAAIIRVSTMKSVAPQRRADEYEVGTPEFRIREDRYTHSTHTRVRIESDSPRSGGGGGTHINSGGFSSRSGKF